jgi:nucleotide-binding universal stress UspA family protein
VGAWARDGDGVALCRRTQGVQREVTAETARVERDQAAHAAGAGAEFARELGATAESIPVTDETNVTVAIASEADRHDTCAAVVGSRGLGRVKAPLLGSTTQGLLRRTRRPVVVVRAPQ